MAMKYTEFLVVRVKRVLLAQNRIVVRNALFANLLILDEYGNTVRFCCRNRFTIFGFCNGKEKLCSDRKTVVEHCWQNIRDKELSNIFGSFYSKSQV